MKKNYKAIIWDWDGTLAQTLDIWLESYKKVFAEYNLFPKDKVITGKAFGVVDAPINFGINQKEIDNFYKKLIKTFNKKVMQVKLYKGAFKLLNTLNKQNYLQALITTSDKTNIQSSSGNLTPIPIPFNIFF